MLVDEIVERLNEFKNAAEHTPPESILGEVSKETFDHVEPRRAGWGEMDMEAWVPFQPAPNGWVLMRRVIVGYEIKLLVVGSGGIDQT